MSNNTAGTKHTPGLNRAAALESAYAAWRAMMHEGAGLRGALTEDEEREAFMRGARAFPAAFPMDRENGYRAVGFLEGWLELGKLFDGNRANLIAAAPSAVDLAQAVAAHFQDTDAPLGAMARKWLALAGVRPPDRPDRIRDGPRRAGEGGEAVNAEAQTALEIRAAALRALLQECETWLDGVRNERDRTRFERRWNDLQDDAALLAHKARALFAQIDAPELAARIPVRSQSATG